MEDFLNNLQTLDYPSFCQKVDESPYTANEVMDASILKYKKAKVKKTSCYYYLLTFTLSPRLAERVGGFSNSYYDRVERYIKKLATNKSWHLAFFSYVREGGDQLHKHTHWHVSIKTTKYFDFRRNCSYYEKIYGKVDKSVSKLSNNINARKYMSKQSEPIVLLGTWDNELDPKVPNSQILRIESKTSDCTGGTGV